MSDVIRWEEPPESRQAYVVGKWLSVAEELQQRPGEWALVYEAAPDKVYARWPVQTP